MQTQNNLLSLKCEMISDGIFHSNNDIVKKSYEELILFVKEMNLGKEILRDCKSVKSRFEKIHNKKSTLDEYADVQERGSKIIDEKIPSFISFNSKLQRLNNTGLKWNEDDILEKYIKDNIRDIKWVKELLQASKSICKITRENIEGTGFITKGGYLFTANHVIPSKAEAEVAFIEFNYERDADGKLQTSIQKPIVVRDDDFVTNEKLDYTRIKLEATIHNQKELEVASISPSKGDKVNIIHHPLGREKCVSLLANFVKDIFPSCFELKHQASTYQGSSGAPVFNDKWQVIGIHHRKAQVLPYNRGTSFVQINEDIKKKKKI